MIIWKAYIRWDEQAWLNYISKIFLPNITYKNLPWRYHVPRSAKFPSLKLVRTNIMHIYSNKSVSPFINQAKLGNCVDGTRWTNWCVKKVRAYRNRPSAATRAIHGLYQQFPLPFKFNNLTGKPRFMSRLHLYTKNKYRLWVQNTTQSYAGTNLVTSNICI